MKVKRVLYILLVPLIAWNALILVVAIIYAYPLLKDGIFHYVLIDRPEFSHISDSLLSFINIITSAFTIIGTTLPFLLLLTRNSYLKNNLALTTCLILLPIVIRLIIGYIAPDPLGTGETIKGEYHIRVYVLRNGKEKSWISEKPFESYKSQERIRWLPYNNENK